MQMADMQLFLQKL